MRDECACAECLWFDAMSNTMRAPFHGLVITNQPEAGQRYEFRDVVRGEATIREWWWARRLRGRITVHSALSTRVRPQKEW